jgi:hypothetical protein
VCGSACCSSGEFCYTDQSTGKKICISNIG